MIVPSSDLSVNAKELLKNIIENDGIVVSKKPIKLANDSEPTYYYYDIKGAIQQPISQVSVGRLGFQVANRFGCSSIGGPTTGAIPIANAICYKSYYTSQPMTAFYVRTTRKDYGLEKWAEGFIIGKVLIVDDVLNTGQSILDCIQMVTAARATNLMQKPKEIIAGVMVVVNRELGLIEPKLKEMGIPLISLFTHSDFKDYITKKFEDLK